MREPVQLEFDFDPGSGESGTSAVPHTHDCYCGTWVCSDETCESVGVPARPYDYGWRLCPFCEEDMK